MPPRKRKTPTAASRGDPATEVADTAKPEHNAELVKAVQYKLDLIEQAGNHIG